MSKLVWDAIGERYYETGTKKGVLYVQEGSAYPVGVAWNGLTGFSESPDGGDSSDIYADDIKYLSLRSRENFKGTITAYTYPEEFDQCNGQASVVTGATIGQQARKPFGFSYVTTIGNDTQFEDYGYKIHLVWGATASPSSKDYKTINDSPEAIEFSWEIDTIPVNVTGYKPTAHMEIDSTKANPTNLQALEDILYGVDAAEAAAATYKKTTDATPQTGKTYYTRSGSSPSYTYSEFSGTTFTSGTDYYEILTPAHGAITAAVARLPLPDEVISILSAT